MDRLGTGRRLAVGSDETGDVAAEAVGAVGPWETAELLKLSGEDVEEIEAEDDDGIGKIGHLALVDGDEVDIRHRAHRSMETLFKTEETFGLDDKRSVELFRHGIGPVISHSLGAEPSVDEKVEAVAAVTVAEEALAGRQLEEAELRVGHHLHEVAVTDALKEGELEQLVVELERTCHRFSQRFMYGSRAGECHTAKPPLSSE